MNRPARVGALCAFLASLAAAAPILAAISVSEGDGRVTVTTPYVAATFSRASGGLLESLTDVDGRLITSAHRLYTDYGLWETRAELSSAYDAGAQLVVERDGDAVRVRASGSLMPKPDSGAAGYPAIRYEAVAAFGASPSLRVSWRVTPELPEPAPSGFMAYLLALPPVRECYANTTDGRLYASVEPTAGRGFQSASRPMSVADPWLATWLDSSTVLHFGAIESRPWLGNVFLHTGDDRSGGLFLARLDGANGGPVGPGETWEAGFTLTAFDSLATWQAGRP